MFKDYDAPIGLAVGAGFAISLSSSSPARLPLTLIDGALPTELRAALIVGSSLSNNAARGPISGMGRCCEPNQFYTGPRKSTRQPQTNAQTL